MRKAFVDALMQLCEKDSKIMLLTGDLGFSVFEKFKERFPEQYLNAGVAEANLVGMAAGLSLEGYKVFIYSIATFLVYRTLEQIRNDLCYQNLPVIVVGVGGGLAYGNAGPSHHATGDIAVMSSLPNMTVICPGDPAEVHQTMKEITGIRGPVYLRLNRSKDPIIHENGISNFKIGKALIVNQGKDVLLISTGNTLEIGHKVLQQLTSKGFSVELISMHTIKPFDQETFLNEIKGKRLVVTIEEHTKYGGLFSNISSLLVENGISINLLPVYLPDSFVNVSSSQGHLRSLYGLDASSIESKVLRMLKNKENVTHAR